LQDEAEAWKKCATSINIYFQHTLLELADQHFNPYYALLRDKDFTEHLNAGFWLAKITDPCPEIYPELSWCLPTHIDGLVDEMDVGADTYHVFNCGRCDVLVVLFEDGECPFHNPASGEAPSCSDIDNALQPMKQDDVLEWEEEGLLEVAGLDRIRADDAAKHIISECGHGSDHLLMKLLGGVDSR
jgi:hypothetical protein